MHTLTHMLEDQSNQKTCIVSTEVHIVSNHGGVGDIDIKALGQPREKFRANKKAT